MRHAPLLALMLLLSACATPALHADQQWVSLPGGSGPGAGKKVVLITGDEEYRSEEGLTQLGRILSKHHGFATTVLYAVDPKTGDISPNTGNNIPGLEALDSADLMIILTRFRDLPDDQMKHIDDYLKAGKPVIGLRTATHAFKIDKTKTYAKYSYNYKGEDFTEGFGRQVLGETWISHHGSHKNESTRALVAPGSEDHAILKGIKSGDIWCDTDVYGVRLPLPGDSKPLLLGQVLQRPGAQDKSDVHFGMKPTDPVLSGAKNDPMMPVAWTKSYQIPGGKKGKSFTTTMGSSTDLENAALRKLLVNAAYWAVDLEDKITGDAKVDLVGEYKPNAYSPNNYKKGVKPADLQIK